MKLKSILLPWDVELLPQKKLFAGDLACMYEAGNLRTIKCGNKEVLRMLYSALRNENWDTIPFNITDERIEENEKQFFISYNAAYNHNDISYKAYVEIEGKADSTITFLMKGQALSSFKRNRIGLCVLHPVKECEGREAELQHTDGTVSRSVFPGLISPHQPFVNVERMKWTIENGLQAELKFEGDVFETEDQRNWTDSSYKTYSTPLSIPFPVTVREGEKMFQRITVSLRRNNNDKVSIKEKAKKDKIEKIPFPKIGYGRGLNQMSLTSSQITQLKNIPFAHLRVELDLSGINWVEQLQKAFTEADQLNTGLELILYFGKPADKQTTELVKQLVSIHEKVVSILVLQKGLDVTPRPLLDDTYRKIKKGFPAIPVGYGTDSHFAALNRNRPLLNGSCDFIGFSLHPQVHASDTRSIFENLQNQADTITTARTFAPGKPIHIFINFGDRNKTGDKNNNYGERVRDPRQHTWFAALWTLLTIQNLGEAKILSFYELSGPHGIIPGDDPPSPIYQALSIVREFEPVWIIRRYHEDDLLTDGLLLENRYGERLFLEADKPGQIKTP